MILTGYIAAKLKLIDQVANEKFSRFVVNVTVPALIISSVTSNINLRSNSGSLNEMLSMVLLAFGVFCIKPFVAIPVVKLLRVPKEDDNLYRFMFVFSNIGFMGLPVTIAIFGEGAVFYASIFNLPFSLLLYTYGLKLVKKESSWKGAFDLKGVFNPGVVAIIISMIIYLTGVQLPFFLTETIRLVGSITTPLSLIVIGSSLVSIPLGEVFREKRLYPFSIITLLGIPILTLFLLESFIVNKVILGVTVIMSGMPVGAMTYMFYSEYKGNTDLATKGIMLSTLLSLLSIPLLALLIYSLNF